MIELDDKFLEEIGLASLPPEEKAKVFAEVYQILETRVGTRLTEGMNDDELDSFEDFMDSAPDEKAVRNWLEGTFPNYQQVVDDELVKLKTEIKNADPATPDKKEEPAKPGDLFKQLGLDHLNDQEKLNISEDLGGVVMDRVAARLEAILTPDQAKEFDRLLQSDESEAFELLEKWVPEYSAIVNEEIERVRSDVVDTQADIMKKLGY